MRGFVLLGGWLACVLGSIACSSDSNDGGSSSSSGVDQLGDRLAEAYCHQLLECCDGTQLSEKFNGASVTDEASCLDETGLFGIVELAFSYSIDRDRIIYHGDALQACLDSMEALACDDFIAQLLSVCDSLVEGLVATGDECSDDYECANGGYCDRSGEVEVCQPLPAGGETCTSKCADGFFCQLEGGVGTCRARLEDGAACYYGTTCINNECVKPEGSSEGICGGHNECTAGLTRFECGPCSAPP